MPRLSMPATVVAFMLMAAGFCACQKEPSIRPGRARVSGSVTYQNKPLPGGEVSLASVTNPMLRGSAIIDKEGRFKLLDAPLGAVAVTVRTDSMRIEQPDRYIAIPKKYTNPEKSGLQIEVKPGENEDLVLRLE